MSMFFGFFGIILLVGIVVGWYWLFRSIKEGGETGPRRGAKNLDRESSAELEAFIAAYRSGKLSSSELKTPATQPAAALPGMSTPQPAVASAKAAASDPAPAPLLRPEVKLAYLTLRAGLRDHHVFPNIRLSDMGRGAANGKVDLLVCDAGFRLIAAIDVFGSEARSDADKTSFLREAGIRYLKLSVGSMPKPADVRTLIYRA